MEPMAVMHTQRRRSNLRTALALGLLALCSLAGFVYKIWSFG